MIDKNEAPEGFEATECVKPKMCFGCAFYGEGICDDEHNKCLPSLREDKQYVIFKRKENLQFPYGSCGEYL